MTVLGDTAHVTARLASMAGVGEILISEGCCAAAGVEFYVYEQRHLQLKGRSEPLGVRVLRAGGTAAPIPPRVQPAA
jgi:class 3 adenylate cyclase